MLPKFSQHIDVDPVLLLLEGLGAAGSSQCVEHPYQCKDHCGVTYLQFR